MVRLLCFALATCICFEICAKMDDYIIQGGPLAILDFAIAYSFAILMSIFVALFLFEVVTKVGHKLGWQE